MIKMLTMIEMYPNMMLGDGIMSDLSDFSVPWKQAVTDGDISTTFLDMGYYSHSAQKFTSPIMNDVSEGTPPLSSTERTNIAGMLTTLFNRKWKRIWDLASVEYNPINNYDMSETENIELGIDSETRNNGTVTNVVDDTTHETGTVTNVTDTDTSQTGTVSDSGSNSNADNLFGFNSSGAVGADTSNGTVTNTRTNNLAGTDDTTETKTNNLTTDKDITDTETRQLVTVNDSTHTTERTLEKAGNIGVTTTQKMVMDELEAWQWTFFQRVFEDIDSICCLDIY